MNRNRLCVTAIACLLLLLAFGVSAQKKSVKSPPAKTAVKKTTVQKSAVQKTSPPPKKETTTEKPADTAQDEKKVRDMVAFLEFVLNTLGSSSTSSRDKDVLITQSYSKIFRDDKVQIEDDLDEERTVVTNKNVVAYLKDVDFFYDDVKFEFSIESIQSGINAANKQFYKVSMKRNMTGTAPDGRKVNNTVPRFIEVNYDPEQQDLKIVSIYTNEFNEKEALTNWWSQLSLEWQTIFVSRLNLIDSVGLEEIRKVTSLDSLDLNNNAYVRNLDPLGELTNLKYLNLSHTQIEDLSPLRNLTVVTDLDLSHTKVKDLSPLRFSSNLVRLNLNHTDVTDISVVQRMPAIAYFDLVGSPVSDIGPLTSLTQLRYLNLAGTKVSTLSSLEGLTQLTELNVARTGIKDLTPIKGLKAMKTLTLDSTAVTNLSALNGFENLAVLRANYTQLSDLQPLLRLPHLERIYCDKTRVGKEIAEAFMASNRKVLVIFDSEDLKAWWNTLATEWQELLSKTATVALSPTKEELARVPSIDSIDLSTSRINDLEPLRRLLKLKVIIAHNTGITDMSALSEHREITYLDISETDVSDISVARQFMKMKILRADKSRVLNIDPLNGLTSLEKLYIEETGIHDIIAQEYLAKNPNCLLVYKTIHLKRWWSRLPGEWKEVFRSQMGKDTAATRENLHHLVELESFHFKESPVSDLSAFSEFMRLTELHFSGTSVTDISPLKHLSGSLKSLHATGSPLQQMESLPAFTELDDLDISNTPLEELKVIGTLKNLKKLNCAGTQVKKLDPLMSIEGLEVLDCSNTRVSNLDPVSHRGLKTLKCYNTKVSTREIEGFKKSNPECSVVYYR